LAYEIPKVQYSGKINEVELGLGKSALKLGGETAYNFHTFEGAMPNPVQIAMEVWDIEPEDWAPAAVEPFADVLKDPGAWAKKCVEEYGAQVIVVQLKGIDPNGLDKSAQEASAQVKKVVDAVDVPIVVWGCASPEKDSDVLKKIAEDFEGKHLSLGPVEEKNHKAIGAAALGYKHTIVSSSPIDVNLAKQVNILLENLGVKGDVIIDPTTGGLGYGLEYSYSVMERLRMAALAQEDEKLQFPIINNIGNEVWKSKEAKMGAGEAPTLGDPGRRGIVMEAVAAVAYALAGSDLLILRHPESVKLVKNFLQLLDNGDLAVSPDQLSEKMAKLKEKPVGDYPAIEKEVVAEEVKAEAPPKKEAAPPKPEPKKEAAPAKPALPKEEKPAVEVKAEAKPEVEDKAKAEEDAKKKAEAEAKAKAEAEAKAKTEAEAKAKAEAEAKAKAEEDAKKKAEKEEAERKAAAKSKALEIEAARRAKRLAERDARMSEKTHVETTEVPKSPAAVQMSSVEKLMLGVDRSHGRMYKE